MDTKRDCAFTIDQILSSFSKSSNAIDPIREHKKFDDEHDTESKHSSENQVIDDSTPQISEEVATENGIESTASMTVPDSVTRFM